MKIFSKASQCAIHAMIHVPETDSLPGFSTKVAFNQADIPEASARKALKEMARVGFLKSIPGTDGGYRFALEP